MTYPKLLTSLDYNLLHKSCNFSVESASWFKSYLSSQNHVTDDTVSLHSLDNAHDSESKTNFDHDERLWKWFDNNLLTLNISMLKIIIYHKFDKFENVYIYLSQ